MSPYIVLPAAVIPLHRRTLVSNHPAPVGDGKTGLMLFAFSLYKYLPAKLQLVHRNAVSLPLFVDGRLLSTLSALYSLHIFR